MRIAVYGATGMIGSRIVTEATNRGHQVTALSRREGVVPDGASARIGDAADPQVATSVAADHDVVVSALGPSRTSDDGTAFRDTIANLVDTIGDTRLLVVGGAGSLLVDGKPLLESPGFPPEYLAESKKGAETLADLRAADDSVDWTYLSPAPEIGPGERTGTYVVGDESPVGSSVSAEDYAVALVDEIEQPAHRRARFTVAN